MARISSLRIATDFSEHADRAARRGARLARALGITGARLIHVAEKPGLLAVQSLLADPIEEAMARAMDASLDAIEADTGYRLSGDIQDGKITEILLEGADAETLVVLGGQGAHAWQDRALGSTATRIVRHSQSPTLAVRGEAPGDYQRVLVPVDLSEVSGQALDMALTIAPDASLELLYTWAPVTVLYGSFVSISGDMMAAYAADQQAAGHDGLSRLCEAHGLAPERVTCTVRRDFPARGILHRARELNADLIVMGKESGHRLEKLLVGSVTSQVLAHADADVLVVPRAPG
ncbi:universal stress protein [Isoalcanivorax pacificus W11-5]|uniref:Universal stress protein n=1 Tax=Isoalcanivorax pacificus W11-5 TaxID=391936 RepID=A0A0B4XKY9_9GAMM|nr:universal stress protein [Isoalcanivorax pacificus]AJD48929.1 universal stress protein [Isoalcanivorax pacificus W11-5]